MVVSSSVRFVVSFVIIRQLIQNLHGEGQARTYPDKSLESDIKLSTNNSPPEVGFAENGYITCFFFVYLVPRLKFGNAD